MSRIVVVGGHGRTGILIVDQLVKTGHSVVATIRNARHMADLVKRGAETVVLDLEASSGPDFQAQFRGADAIVFAAGSGEGESSAIDRKGIVKTVRAAETAGVKRYVAVSALGATTPVPKQWKTPEMKDYWAAKRAANEYVRESELDWTIIEPGELTDGKPTGKVTLSQTGLEVGKIARGDVAAVVVAVLGLPRSGSRTFQVTGGKTPIADALKAALAAK